MKPEFWRDCAFWIFSSLQIRSFLFYSSFLLRTNQNHFPAWPVSLSGLKTPADSLHKSALVSPRPGRLKRCIIPNICILISSVTLTRTPVNKAINQTRVREGSGGERERERGGSSVLCVWVQCCLIRMNVLLQKASEEDENGVTLNDIVGVWFSTLCAGLMEE